ncbi:MAG: DUF4125 family protein [Lachnospiraceae bacterium]|nr:DUF4125 family protein [Lachnospiraceae bacterium]
MDIDLILKNVDRLYEEKKPEEAEALLLSALSMASEEGDSYTELRILNELIGHYRVTTQAEKSYIASEQALDLAERILPVESIPYATTLLNAATAYRGGGRLDDSLACYEKVKEIYGKVLKKGDPQYEGLYASLYNNRALLFQEKGDFAGAKESLIKALELVKESKKLYEEAVSRANLAGTLIQLGEFEEAYEQACISKELFNEQEVEDQHLCAAMSAIGSYHFMQKEYAKAAEVFKETMELMERTLGKNGYYYRLKENYETALEELNKTKNMSHKDPTAPDTNPKSSPDTNPGSPDKDPDSAPDNNPKSAPDTNPNSAPEKGMDICRKYYETYGRKMIEEKFADYIDKIAVGLVGEGSDCYGYDDLLSRDHDFGPSFCMWLSDETYEEIGEELEEAYEALPDEIDGVKRSRTVNGSRRRGVAKISDFYSYFTGSSDYEGIDWKNVNDTFLSASVNGQVWKDEEGIFTVYRNKLLKGYPLPILFAKLAESCSRFAQCGQYNYERVLKRGDVFTAELMRSDALKEAMKLKYLSLNLYYPHDKWLYKGIDDLEGGAEFKALLQEALRDPKKLEDIGAYFSMELYRRDYISDIDPYLGNQTEELLEKAIDSNDSIEELAMKIAKLEFEAFDKVKNEGGRAECQNNWPTFSIMRRSQYLTWDKTMLLQYIYDFRREMRQGHNLITEKYGRMMESTAPEEYEKIKDNFIALTDEKKSIIDTVAGLQVQWMEKFAAEYPKLAGQARSIRSSQDNLYNTSYETYLRGELGTYSDKMLELYARFIVSLAREGRNLAYETMENSAHLYGYKDLKGAEMGISD